MKRNAWVGLFNRLVRHPPLDPHKGGLDPFEFVVLAAVVTTARIKLADDDHKESLDDGNDAMRRQRDYAARNCRPSALVGQNELIA